MTTTQAINHGLSSARRAAWMVTLFYACNLLLAAAIAAPMHTAIADHLGHSALGEQMAHDFSSAWLTEFQFARAGFFKDFSITVVYAGILFLALNTVLLAGAFEVFKQGAGARMHTFGRGIGKYFFRFARLAVIASLAYFAAFWFWQGPAAKFVDWVFDNSVHENGHFFLTWLRWLLLFFTVFSINAIVEYAKADIAIDEHPSALAALGHAAGFVIRRFARVMFIYLAVGFLSLLAIFAYAAFARFFPQSSVLAVLIWFLVAQALFWLRWMFRLASWGAAVGFYGAHLPRSAGEPAMIADAQPAN